MNAYLHPPVSSLVSPVVPIVSSSSGNPTEITTLTPHYLWSGDTVTIEGHSLNPNNGVHVVTVLTPTTFAIDAGGGSGEGGTVTLTLAAEPLTLAEAKLRAGLLWTSPDPRDAMLHDFLRAARRRVEVDTHLAIRLQVRDVYVDDLSNGLGWPVGPHWPGQSLPLQAVTAVTRIDSADVPHLVDPAVYQVDTASGRLALAAGQSWPATTDLRALSPWVVRVVAGYPTPAAIPADLVWAIGLLCAHHATAGRDLVALGSSVAAIPMGYDEALAPYRMEVVA